MPCDSSHMEPTREELICRLIATITDELDGKNPQLSSYKCAGFHPRTYCKAPDPDVMTRQLCERFQSMTPEHITSLSLEAQMWWRDHQEADRRRERDEAETKQREALKASAIAKLTKQERDALGL